MDLTVGRFLRFVIAIFIMAVIGWILYELSNIITILIISALLAYILDPFASYLEAKGLSRSQASMLIFVVLILVVGLSTWLLGGKLFNELSSLQQSSAVVDSSRVKPGDLTPDTLRVSLNQTKNTPFREEAASRGENIIKPGTDSSQLSKVNTGSGYTDNGEIRFLADLEDFITTTFTFIDRRQVNLQERFRKFTSGISGQIVAFIPNMVSIIMAIVIIPFVAFFLLKDGREMKKLFVSHVPNRYFEMTLNVLHKIDMQLGGYLRGQFIEAFVIASLSVIALAILQVKYFTIIGIVAGLANMVPYVGPVAGAVPAIIVTLANGDDFIKLLYIVIAFAIVQLIDNILVQPLVLSRSVNLHPLIIVFAVLIGGQFFGLLGMLLAVPSAGIIKVTFMEIYNAVRKYHLI